MPTQHEFDDLAAAIWAIGRELPIDSVTSAVWQRLRDLKLVTTDAVKLTAKGKRMYNALERDGTAESDTHASW
jgi:hypothetical protein